MKKRSVSLPIELIVILILSLSALLLYITFFYPASTDISISIFRIGNESTKKLSNVSKELNTELAPYSITNKLVITRTSTGSICNIESYRESSMYAICISEICENNKCSTRTVSNNTEIAECSSKIYKCFCDRDKKECKWI